MGSFRSAVAFRRVGWCFRGSGGRVAGPATWSGMLALRVARDIGGRTRRWGNPVALHFLIFSLFPQ